MEQVETDRLNLKKNYSGFLTKKLFSPFHLFRKHLVKFDKSCFFSNAASPFNWSSSCEDVLKITKYKEVAVWNMKICFCLSSETNFNLKGLQPENMKICFVYLLILNFNLKICFVYILIINFEGVAACRPGKRLISISAVASPQREPGFDLIWI